ncbi:hypothetical protein BGX34_001681 [Mortierella sp. NVP85]|nr:hypothetical protein BGX34_001681 [Mortierella sp. NVP85]
MNDAFQASEKEGKLAHYKHLVEVIAEVKKYWSKYSISDASNLSAENRFMVEKSSANHHTIMNDIKALAEEVRSEQKEMAELKLLVANILGKLDDMNARLNKE